MSAGMKKGLLFAAIAALLIILVLLVMALFIKDETPIPAADSRTTVAQSTEPETSTASEVIQPSPTERSSAGGVEQTSSRSETVDPAADKKDNTFTGTIRVMALNDLLAVLGHSAPPNGEPPSTTYNVFVLDQPSELTAARVGNRGEPTTETTSVVGLKANFADRDGDHVTMHFPPNQTQWPSDTSMPIGAPRTDAAEIVGEG